MSDIKLGELAGPGAKRDAIHIAVFPATSHQTLCPGERVGFVAGCVGVVKGVPNGGVGIVDPFLTHPVPRGLKFWVLLNPGTITGLRHEWTHPAFAAEESDPFAIEPSETIEREQMKSVDWLRQFCRENDCPDYATLMKALDRLGETVDDDDEFSPIRAVIDDDSDGLTIIGMSCSAGIPPEFWTHVEVVTGKKFPHKPKYFSCSC